MGQTSPVQTSGARAPLIVATVLGVLLVSGGALAWLSSGTPVVAGAPSGSPPAMLRAGAGSNVVQLSADAAAHPDVVAVLVQLQRHYDAINNRDYAAWKGTVVAERAAALPESRWRSDYSSTTDGTIRVDRIDRIGGTPGADLLVLVRFASTQAVADAPTRFPAERICWRTTLPMTAPASGAPPRLDRTGGGSSVAEVC